jgi:hypothetical protein
MTCSGGHTLYRRGTAAPSASRRLARPPKAWPPAAPPTANPDKYQDELLDAYLFVEDADALYAEYAAQGVEFARGLRNMPWHCREFVVKDCDGRLLAFGANL